MTSAGRGVDLASSSMSPGSYLVDTNVLSELRKGPRADPNVAAWFESVPAGDLFLSVLTVGEIRKGVERIRLRDRKAARSLDAWLRALVSAYDARILPIDRWVAEEWGRLNVPDPVPVVDGLIAATALVHGMAVATRNTRDLERTGVRLVNPFAPPGARRDARLKPGD